MLEVEAALETHSSQTHTLFQDICYFGERCGLAQLQIA